MPNSLNSENLASLWVTSSVDVDERALWAYLFFTRAAKIPVHRPDIPEPTIFQSGLDCFVNELVCLL